MSSAARLTREHGGVLSATRLVELGCAPARVRAAVAAGELRRVRNGWFATPDAPREIVRAVRVGGTATAATVARRHRLWVHADDRLHVRVRHSTGRLSSPDDRSIPLDRERDGVCVHYRTRGGLDRASDPLSVALAEMFSCAGEDDVLATIDSAVERGVLAMGHLDLIRDGMPRSRRHLVDRVDPSCQSGLETRVRLLLRSKRIEFRAQAAIEGVGTVDVLVGARLIIEVDGRAFHSGAAFEADRRRDFEALIRGYVVMRLSYRQVIEDWERTRAGILALVARGEHRGPRRATPMAALPLSVLHRESPIENA
ncbi:endonuclease domain-containing protein [Agromyces sp. SYSU T00266]|uniref:endonuclease domain-containing protein n=1 Tax=Agromyces zhanjiangensis TaxID=3158562 RepID=UPI0033940734